ncbi:MAG: NUMOD4 domain-containing protein [Bacilli bacterium]
MKEEWKKINDFDYEISNLGNLRTLNTKELKKLQLDKDGYYTTTLWKNGKSYFKRINRLVAEAFIPNPDNLPVVNHKDENKSNNHVDNLEWCTVGYNNIYSKARPIVQIDFDGNFICEYKSIKEAEDKTGFRCAHIQDCCSDKKIHYKTYKGFQWLYKEDYDGSKDYKITPPMPNRGRQVAQYDLDGNLIKVFPRLAAVSENKHYNSTVGKCCRNILNTAYGYKWEYI